MNRQDAKSAKTAWWDALLRYWATFADCGHGRSARENSMDIAGNR